jgi:hypothetical protein
MELELDPARLRLEMVEVRCRFLLNLLPENMGGMQDSSVSRK